MIRGIILEGVSCSGKTSLLRSLKLRLGRESELERSNLFLGEHYTQVLQNIAGKSVRYNEIEHLQILKKRIEMLEELSDFSSGLGPASRRSRGLLFVFERFHLNHRTSFSDLESIQIEEIEARLSRLNAMCVLLTISKDKILTRLKERGEIPTRQGIQGIAKFTTAGELDETVTLIDYQTEQDALLRAANQSKLPTSIINTDHLDWDFYAEEILNRLDEVQQFV